MAQCLADRLTAVLLTYNCAHRVGPVLDRMVGLGLRVIAVDNGSTDATAEVIARHPGIELVRLPRNAGAAGRNAGAELATTPYVLFCDDDEWFEAAGLSRACDLFDRHERLALLNARIVVGPEEVLDPISAEMAASPLADTAGIPGAVLIGFMAGAVIVRVSAYQEVGGYDERFFIGGEEETLAFQLVKAGWQLRYVPWLVVHHRPSLANAGRLAAVRMRNTLVNAWLHRCRRSALRWTAFTLADAPKNRDWLKGVVLTLRAVPWIVRERRPMAAELDAMVLRLDARRFAGRRPLFTRRAWTPGDPLPREPRPAAAR